jgi:small GTP-binding protein
MDKCKKNKRLKLFKESFLTTKSYEKSIYRFKIILIGDVAVGKTAILTRFLERRYSSQYNCTINVDIRIETVCLDDQTIVDLQIWDTCGQETFKHLTKQYYHNSTGCFLVYDVTNRSSFDDLSMWIYDVKEYGPRDIVLFLVGNKADLESERVVSFEEADSLAKYYKIDYIEASAKNAMNVNFMFELMCLAIVNKFEESITAQTNDKINYTSISGQDIVNITSYNNKNGKYKKCC